MIKVDKVLEHSEADKKGIKVGEYLISINDKSINDRLDFLFYSADFPLEIKIKNDLETRIVSIEDSDYDDLGLELADFKIKHCGNKCVFCFIDQNKPNLREALYVKDEDFRFSFLYGNFFTMTNLTKEELERIVEQRLSPLYVSVHAIDKKVRQKLLGIKREDKFLEKLKYLTDNNIVINTQIVLCPGINDGKVLEETITTLAGFYPKVATLAVVPIGLTKYRDGLEKLALFTKEGAVETVNLISKYQEKYIDDFGSNFVFPADEFFLKSQLPIPNDEYYEGYELYENGIGMVRSYLEDLAKVKKTFPKSLKKKKHICLITGLSFAPILKEHLLPILNNIKKLKTDVNPITNQFFGNTITVAGLLSGQDIVNAVKACYQNEMVDLVALPNNCINSEGYLLDDMTIKQMSEELGTKVVVISDFEYLIEELLN